MRDLALVDSSAWIAATRQGGDREMAEQVGELLLSGRAAMTEPVWLELYQGIRGEREEARLEETRRACVWLTFDDRCWQVAATTARACLRAGVNVPFGDVLAYSCAKRHDVELLEQDRHFAMIMICKAMEP
jgi:predicted nucleic acid-binding protein